MKVLADEEIMVINQTAEFDSAIGYARKIEAAVLEKLSSVEPVAWRWEVETYGDGKEKHCPEQGFSSAGNVCKGDEPLYLHPPVPSAVEWTSVKEQEKWTE